MDELDAFERKVAEKKGQQMVGPDTPAEAPDYLDEYLERLQISRQEETDESKEAEKNKNNINNDNSEDKVPLEDQPVSRYSFIRLLLLFMSLVSMAKLLKYGNWPKTRNHNNNNTFYLQRPLCLNFRNLILINLFLFNFYYRRGR